MPDVMVGADAAAVGMYYTGSKKQSEIVVYWRRPKRVPVVRGTGTRPCPDAGWIFTADYQANKRLPMIERGFEPLVKYGPVSRKEWGFDSAFQWAAILNHPDGPSEFPIEQILRLGWFDPERLPPGVPQDVYFPQLEGVKIPQHECPVCTDRPPFLTVREAARHMMDTHEWRMEDVLVWGESLGIDLRAEFTPKAGRSFVYHGTPREDPRAKAKARPQYDIERSTIPERDELGTDDEPFVAVAVAQAAPAVKAKRTQSPEQAAKSRAALAKARLAREAKKSEQASDPKDEALAAEWLKKDES